VVVVSARGGRLAGVLIIGLVVAPGLASVSAAADPVNQPSAVERGVQPVRPLPRAASRLIVPPAAIGLVVGRDLMTADLRVRDGCGHELRLGRTNVDGDTAAAALPYQATGAGQWRVNWAARPVSGAALRGEWTFDVVDGDSCPAVNGGDGRAPTAGTIHHSGMTMPAAGPTGGFEPHPRLALLLAGIAGLALLGLGMVLLRRSTQVHGVSPADLLVVVGLHTVVLLAAATGEPLPVRLGLAVPGAVAVTGCTVRAVAHLPGRGLRALVSGLSAAAVTLGVVGLWGSGQAVLLDAPPADLFGSMPGPVTGAAMVAGVLSVGGWYGSRRHHG
jgi:hypothetical protein